MSCQNEYLSLEIDPFVQVTKNVYGIRTWLMVILTTIT